MDRLASAIRGRMDDLMAIAKARIVSGDMADDIQFRVRELQWVLDQITGYEGLATTTSDDDPLTPYKVWEWWNGKVGMVPGRMPGKAAKSAKLLLDRGATVDDLDALWGWLKADPWWSKHGIDLGMMVAAYDKWLAAKAVGPVEDAPSVRRWKASDGRL